MSEADDSAPVYSELGLGQSHAAEADLLTEMKNTQICHLKEIALLKF